MTAWGMAIPCIIQRMCGKSTFPVSSSPSEVEGSFSLAVRRSAFDSEERETPYRGKADGVSRKRLSEGGGKRGKEKISRCARNDSVGDGYSVHHTKNVWEKHVSRIVIGSGAEGLFSLMVRRRVSDREERETPYHGKWEKRVSRIVIPSEVEGSFSLAVRRSVFDSEERETPYRRKVDGASRKRLSEGGGERGGRKRFLAALEMTAWGMAIPCIIQRMCGKSVLPVSSSRAESRGLFRWRQEGERLTARNGKHRITGSGKGAFLVSSSRAKSRDLFRWR